MACSTDPSTDASCGRDARFSWLSRRAVLVCSSRSRRMPAMGALCSLNYVSARQQQGPLLLTLAPWPLAAASHHDSFMARHTVASWSLSVAVTGFEAALFGDLSCMNGVMDLVKLILVQAIHSNSSAVKPGASPWRLATSQTTAL